MTSTSRERIIRGVTVRVLGPMSTGERALSPRERSMLSALIIRAGAPARADELADAYGERFRPTAYLRDLAAKGESLPA